MLARNRSLFLLHFETNHFAIISDQKVFPGQRRSAPGSACKSLDLCQFVKRSWRRFDQRNIPGLGLNNKHAAGK